MNGFIPEQLPRWKSLGLISPSISMQTKKSRFLALDGLRGIASLAVCVWHNFLAFFPGSGSNVPVHCYFLERIIYPSPLCLFFGGDFAVYIFFVLSGFVLSIKYYRNPDMASLKTQFLRRYIRLMPPAAVTILVSCIILNAGLMYNVQAANLASSWWLNLNWHDVNPSFLNALWQSLWGVWFTQLQPGNAFNSNLLTLFIEILGSFIIFSFLIICISLNLRKALRYTLHGLLIAFIIFVLQDPHYAVFMIGMFMADLYVNSFPMMKLLGNLGLIFLLLGLFLGSINIANFHSAFYSPISAMFSGITPPWYWAWMFGSLCLLVSALFFRPFITLLETKPFQFLGSYSYALYLCHTVFLGSYTCYVFTKIMILGKFTYTESVAISCFSGLPLLALFVYVVKKVDDYAISISRKV